MLFGRSQTSSVYAQAFDDPTPPPAHPFLYPTMSISEPGEAPTGDAAAQGSGLIGPVPRSVNVLFRPDFRHSSQARGSRRRVKIVPPRCPVQGGINKN